MQRFKQVFGNSNCKIIAMLHASALPGKLYIIRSSLFLYFNYYYYSGSPKYDGNWNGTIERLLHETQIYIKHKVASLQYKY